MKANICITHESDCYLGSDACKWRTLYLVRSVPDLVDFVNSVPEVTEAELVEFLESK